MSSPASIIIFISYSYLNIKILNTYICKLLIKLYYWDHVLRVCACVLARYVRDRIGGIVHRPSRTRPMPNGAVEFLKERSASSAEGTFGLMFVVPEGLTKRVLASWCTKGKGKTSMGFYLLNSGTPFRSTQSGGSHLIFFHPWKRGPIVKA